MVKAARDFPHRNRQGQPIGGLLVTTAASGAQTLPDQALGLPVYSN